MTFMPPHNFTWIQNWIEQQDKIKLEREKAAAEKAQWERAQAQARAALSNQFVHNSLGQIAQNQTIYPGLAQSGLQTGWIGSNTLSTVGNISTTGNIGVNSVTFRVASEPTVPPSFEPGMLEALKAAEPRRVDEPKSIQVTDSLSCIVGWRAWRLWPDFEQVKSMPHMRDDLPLLLRAVAYHNTYPVMEKMTAICLCAQNAVNARAIFINGTPSMANPAGIEDFAPQHVAPDWNCNCGIWAFKTLDHLMAVLGQHHYGKLPVLGTVNMWGRVIETENGFRAQYAYPKELWLVDPAVERVGGLYKVPIRTADYAWPKETMDLTYNTFI